MTKEEKKIILETDVNELRSYFRANKNILLKFLKEMRAENNGDETAFIIETLFLIAFSEDMFLENEDFQKILCKISKDKNHYQHENIALLLEYLHSPKLIDCAYDLAIAEFEYMEFDEFFNIARKCSYALGYTNTPKAKEKLELLAKNKNELIREYATKQLNRHDFTNKDVD